MALHFEGTELVSVVASRSDAAAWRLAPGSGDSLSVQRLQPLLLGELSPQKRLVHRDRDDKLAVGQQFAEGASIAHAELRAERPSFIISSRAVPEEPGQYPGTTDVLSHGRPIGAAAGLERLGLHVERLPSGHRTSFPHAHEDEEEFVYVLDGEVEAWIDGTLHRMVAGDLAAFPAGTGIGHTIINRSGHEATLLVGGERSSGKGRIRYPLNLERREQMAVGRWWDGAPGTAATEATPPQSPPEPQRE